MDNSDLLRKLPEEVLISIADRVGTLDLQELDLRSHQEDDSSLYTINPQEVTNMDPQFKQPWRAPVFGDAFTTPLNLNKPPGSSPLLKQTSSIIFVPASYTTAAEPDGIPPLPTCTPDTAIELRVSHFSAASKDTLETGDSSPVIRTVHPTHTLPIATYHCTNMWDLVVILRYLTSVQRASIATFKIRWYTAQCALWEFHHPEHATKTSSSAFGQLTGLEKVVVDCEGRREKDVVGVKEELEEWIGGMGVEVEMVGFKKDVVKKEITWGWYGGAGGGEWGWEALGKV
jgi:hypothetical protein